MTVAKSNHHRYKLCLMLILFNTLDLTFYVISPYDLIVRPTYHIYNM